MLTKLSQILMRVQGQTLPQTALSLEKHRAGCRANSAALKKTSQINPKKPHCFSFIKFKSPETPFKAPRYHFLCLWTLCDTLGNSFCFLLSSCLTALIFLYYSSNRSRVRLRCFFPGDYTQHICNLTFPKERCRSSEGEFSLLQGDV